MGNGNESRDAVDRRSEIIAIVHGRRARMDGHANSNLTDFPGPRVSAQQALRFDGSGHRFGRSRESTAERIADGLKDLAVVPLENLAEERVVIRERNGHRVGMLLPRPSTAHDVREQECHGSARQGRGLASFVQAVRFKRPSGDSLPAPFCR